MIPVADAATQYIIKPHPLQNVTEGGELHLKWTYELDSSDVFEGVSLGTYLGGVFKVTYIEVDRTGTVLNTLPSFDGRLTWRGDLSQKKIEFVLYPVKESDAGEFTCGINRGFFKGFVPNRVTLDVYGKSISIFFQYCRSSQNRL